MDIDREKISYIIGQRIYDFRTQKKLSQEALAFESEIHIWDEWNVGRNAPRLKRSIKSPKD